MIDDCLGSPKITVRVLGNTLVARYKFSTKKCPIFLLWHHSRLSTIEMAMHRVGRQLSAGFHSLWLMNSPWCLTNALLDNRTQVTYFFPQNCRLGNLRIHTRQSTVIRGKNPQTHTKSPWPPHEEFTDTWWGVCRHFTKNLRNRQKGSVRR